MASHVVEGWNWGAGAFVFVYVLFFGTGMAYAVIAEEGERVVVQGRRWCGARGRVRLGVVQHGPCRGLGKSGEPGVLQRARGGRRWSLPGAAGGARVGSDVVRNGGDLG
jgi:hypothetical protein